MLGVALELLHSLELEQIVALVYIRQADRLHGSGHGAIARGGECCTVGILKVGEVLAQHVEGLDITAMTQYNESASEYRESSSGSKARRGEARSNVLLADSDQLIVDDFVDLSAVL